MLKRTSDLTINACAATLVQRLEISVSYSLIRVLVHLTQLIPPKLARPNCRTASCDVRFSTSSLQTVRLSPGAASPRLAKRMELSPTWHGEIEYKNNTKEEIEVHSTKGAFNPKTEPSGRFLMALR